MNRSEIIKVLRKSECNDPFDCPFDLCRQRDGDFETICKATNPPTEIFNRSDDECLMCMIIADELESNN